MKRRLASVSRSAELHSRLLGLITLHPAFFFALGLAVAFAVLRPATLPVPAFDPTRPVEIRGWICSPPLVLSDSVEFEFQPARVTQRQQPVTVWGRILVRIYSSTWPPKQYFGAPLSFGESLEMTGLLVEPAYNAVPGVIDSRIFAVHKKTYYRMRIKSPLQLLRLGYSAHPLALIQVTLFKYIQAFEEASSSRLTLTAFQLIAGAFLGRRQFLEHQMTLRIQELGIQHLFVVSGLHVGLVLAFAGFSLRRLGVPGQLAALSIMWIY
ncbi:MAG: ComEC/Rec2 family competence protein, partial [Acidobacteriota bacterium]